ncbi:type II toxin-antitoxin system RelE/ParE family toxin [Maridesulfovibrio sp.]|uniref:type II toxin-antitoxin system RelE/ParE family toxin n=1 Tax=Maridesulfovibrio sp. TaxID=2795000 RepID=UPI002A187C09|nr:type II toxin-antitoxin system RelE/ParE family toxin [Maridesulfovibrio sp.]
MFQLTNKAYDDLKSIARYTQKTWGIEQRKEYMSRLDQSFHLIAENIGIGRNCDHIREGYFSHLVGRHLIFYRVEDKTVMIVRILHQNMDVERGEF